MKTLDEFKKTLQEDSPPAGLDGLLLGLWVDARGDWERAHEIAQEVGGRDGAWLHAYLHRKEPDLANASYWYHRAGQPICEDSLEEEWEQLVERFLGDE